jgi:hypothetical protein
MIDTNAMSKDELVANIERGWNDFGAFLQPLTDEQLTRPTDAAGWTAKDHLIHIAAWEDSVNALLQGLARHEYMGIDEAMWESGDVDQINAVIQQRFKDMSLEEVWKTLGDVHQQLMEKIHAMSDDDLKRPYRTFQPTSTREAPIINWIIGNTYEHYAEHTPWITAIVNEGQD